MPRMPAAGGLDLRRLYKRFVLLVMIPTACLIGFGVLAIHNERLVVEQRFSEQYGRRLRLLAEHISTLLETTAEGMAKGTSVPNAALIRYRFTVRGNTLTPTIPLEPKLHESVLASISAFKPPSDGRVVLLPILIGPARGLYAVRLRDDGALVGLSFSESAMSAAITKEAEFFFPWDPAHYTLAGPPEGTLSLIRPLSSMLSDTTTEQVEAGLVSLPLPGALSDWRVVAELSGNDPAREALWRNRFIYILTLVLCSVFITTGALTTMRSIWLETRLSRLRTDFVSNISHELRTPLTSIRMFAETLRTGRAQTPEEQAACVDFIARESERLSVLAERTLDWARIEAGRQQYILARSSPAEFVRSVVESFLSRGLIARECVRLEVADGLPDIKADATALAQVLLNLLENAVKYTNAEKQIAVRVRHHRKSVLIEVEDNGIGISRKNQRRIFERFFRADDLLARQTEGTGLGLSIAQRIVEAHHGRLTLRSEIGRGSVFTIRLPAVLSPAASTAPKEHAA